MTTEERNVKFVYPGRCECGAGKNSGVVTLFFPMCMSLFLCFGMGVTL